MLIMIKRKLNWEQNNDKYIGSVIVFLVILLVEFAGTLSVTSITNNSSEFNVIAMAAGMAGYDWTDVMLQNYYYGFTSSLLFMFIFLIKPLVSNTWLLLHGMLLINIILSAISATILYLILYNYIKSIKWKCHPALVVLLSIAVSLFLSNQVLTKNITNENFLVLCFYVAVYIIGFGNKCNNKVSFQLQSIFLALVVALSYSTNGRGIILIGITLLMFVVGKCLKIKPFASFVTFLASLFVFFIILTFFKHFILDMFYSGAVNSDISMKNNDIKGILDRAFNLINLQGIKLYIKLLIGWGEYYIVSTHGLGLVAVVFLGKNIVQKFLGKTEVADSVFLLSVVCIAFLFLITVLGIAFYHDSFYAMSFDPNSDLAINRVDKLVYGRYVSTIKSITIAIGLISCFSSIKKEYRMLYFIPLFLGMSVAFFRYIVIMMEGNRYAAVDIPEFALFIRNFCEDFKFGIVDKSGLYLCISITFVIFLILLALIIKKKYFAFVCVLLAVNMILGVLFNITIIKPRNEYYGGLVSQEFISNINSLTNKNNVIVIVDEYDYLYQINMPDIKVIRYDKVTEGMLNNYTDVYIGITNEMNYDAVNAYIENIGEDYDVTLLNN